MFIENNNINAEISEDLVTRIRKELVEKTYYNDVKYNIYSKSRWKITGDVTEAISQILVGIAAMLAFAAGSFDYALLSFIAGCFATGSLVLLRFSSYATKESKERTEQVNILLQKLGLDKIPDIAISSMLQNETPIVQKNLLTMEPNNTLEKETPNIEDDETPNIEDDGTTNEDDETKIEEV